MNLFAALFVQVTPPDERAPLLAAGAMLMAQTRGARHPRGEQFNEYAFKLLTACGGAREAPPEQFEAWFIGLGLNDEARFVPQLDAALVALVGEGGWLFDRRLFDQAG